MYKVTFTLDLGDGVTDKHTVKVKSTSVAAACAQVRKDNPGILKDIVSARAA